MKVFGRCVPPGTQATSIGSWVKLRSRPNCSPSETFGKHPALHFGQDTTGCIAGPVFRGLCAMSILSLCPA